MKVSTENDNNFGYEKITIVVDNIPLSQKGLLALEYGGVRKFTSLKIGKML